VSETKQVHVNVHLLRLKQKYRLMFITVPKIKHRLIFIYYAQNKASAG